VIDYLITRYQIETRDFSLIEIEAVHGSGPVNLWFNERLRKESRMGPETDMFGGL
jgi:hypothetical protein